MRRPTLALLALLVTCSTAAGPAVAKAPSLLSGYGGPGAGSQVILNQHVTLPGGRSGASGAGSTTGGQPAGGGLGVQGGAAGSHGAAGSQGAAGPTSAGPAAVGPGSPANSRGGASGTATGSATGGVAGTGPPARSAAPVPGPAAARNDASFGTSDIVIVAAVLAGLGGLGLVLRRLGGGARRRTA